MINKERLRLKESAISSKVLLWDEWKENNKSQTLSLILKSPTMIRTFWILALIFLLSIVYTWRWKSIELAWKCTEYRNSIYNELGNADLLEWPWAQLMCCASYKLHGYNFREWLCKKERSRVYFHWHLGFSINFS